MSTNVILAGVYDYRLVALSVGIAIIASFAALDLAGRIPTASGKFRLMWLWGAAIAMGFGIAAMHFIGMEALHLPMPMMFDWPTVLISLAAAILASGLAFHVAGRPAVGLRSVVFAGICMGSGVAATHYLSMEAMRIPVTRNYSPGLVLLSILMGIILSAAALNQAFRSREASASNNWRRFSSALLLGIAIASTHYIGMAAMHFVLRPTIMDHDSVSIGFGSIAAMTLAILGLVFIASVVGRRFSRQEQELVDNRQQLQTIFDNMNDGIVVLDLQRNVLHANHTAIKLLGPLHRNLTNAEGAEIYQVLLPNGQFLARDQWPSAKAVRGEFIEHQEFIIRRNDEDREIVAEITTTPITNAAGETIQVIVTYRDISVFKLNIDTRARLAAIVDSSEDAIIGKDDTGIITSWNTAAERIFGYTAEEIIGQSILRLLPADRREEEFEFLNRLKRGEVIDHVETVRRTKSGKLLHVSLTISPIRDVNGKIVGASKIARDITPQKQLERQLQQSQKMEAIGQLTGGIAHDFNNLLAVIVGNLSLVERLIPGNETALKRVHTAQKAAARGADLTRRLLAFSSTEELKPAPTKLSHSIRNTIELATRTLGPEIKIVTKLDENIPPVFVDPAGLENALLNLAVNARDAMPRGGSITITTELVTLEENYPPVKTGELKSGRYACVSVTDTGEGMSRETIERALEPFFTTKPRGKGTGLGLAMVYGFVKQSGGTIRIYSEPGYGTTITFYLQLAQTVAKPAAAVVEQHTASTRGGKVLVVDDEVDLLDIAVAYLEQMGYTPLHAVDGASALEIIERNTDIALVITDVIMPGGMNGAELVQKIRRLHPEIKVIYSSGFPADALAERSGTLVDGLLLHKPYQHAEFDAMVRQVMEGNESTTGQVSIESLG
jgi:PAS domain S-box-containing protein